MDEPLLRLADLRVEFPTDAGIVRAVDGVSYELWRGETLAVVGESGCGKSVTAMAILGLTQSQRGRISGGSVEFDGRALLELSEAELQTVRGREIAMIFQEPMTSLNPVYSIGNQIAEVLQQHLGMGEEQAMGEAVRLLERVKIPSAQQRIHEYPHQLSGGMRQRVMIAMALACEPQLLIADEPTTALDVTVQAQILDLIAELQADLGMAVLLITHDLGVVAQTAQRVVVMYAGQVVETASVEDLFDNPLHPYTAGLMASLPRLDVQGALTPIEGNVPDALNLPSGCRFHPRCPVRLERCQHENPPSVHHASFEGSKGPRSVSCFYRELHPAEDLLRHLRERSSPQGQSPSQGQSSSQGQGSEERG